MVETVVSGGKLGVFTTFKHLHFTLTVQGGRWTGVLKCYFGKDNRKLVSFNIFPSTTHQYGDSGVTAFVGLFSYSNNIGNINLQYKQPQIWKNQDG